MPLPRDPSHAPTAPLPHLTPIPAASPGNVSPSGPHPASPRAAQARTVVPELIKDPSTLEAFATTLRTWSPFDTPYTTSDVNGALPGASERARLPRSGRSGAAGPGAVSAARTAADERQSTAADALMLGEEVDEDGNCRGSDKLDGSELHSSAAVDLTLPPRNEKVAWARWDALPGGIRVSRRVLILGYMSGGLAVWDCSSLDCWTEVLNLPTIDCAFSAKLHNQFPRGIDRVVGAAVIPSPAATSQPDSMAADRPLLAILARPASHHSSSVVFLYSLRTHRIISSVPVPGVAQRILANCRFLVVSTTSPLALHVYQRTASASGYAPAPFSPLTDVVSCPASATASDPDADLVPGGPVFDLGCGGRLLAYATSTPVLSSTLARTSARPGAGILAHRGQFDSDTPPFASGGDGMNPAGFSIQDAEDMARRVGEGVKSGVAALRDKGGSWLRGTGGTTSGAPSAAATAAAGGNDSTYSRSAPQMGAGGLSAMTAARPVSHAGEASPTAGTVKVVDLVASAAGPVAYDSFEKPRSFVGPPVKVIAHFRPYNQALALASFSPSSTMLLVASTAGHSFDLFELKPSVPVGVSATTSASRGTGLEGKDANVWHRYRLHRGFTSALATSSSWSVDGRFVSVSTAKGTAHIWAVQPRGSAPHLESHFSPQVSNPQELAPLSVALASIARVRHPRLAPPVESVAGSGGHHTATSAPLPVLVSFLPKRDSIASALRSTSTGTRSASAAPAFQDVLVFRPSTGSATLHRLSVQRVPSPAATPAAAAELVRSGDVGRLASTAVSGLSQLMRSRGGAFLQGGATRTAVGTAGFGTSGGGSSGGGEAERNHAWSVKCTGMAEWQVGRETGAREVREDVRSVEKVEKRKREDIRYSAFAEIETYSRSPLVLPRSLYQSQQFEFYALPADHAHYAAEGLSKMPMRRLEMRSEVQIRQGDGSMSSDAGPSLGSSPHTGLRYAGYNGDSSSFEPASFDQPIKTAMHALLDFDQVAPGSPKLPPPTFPNGVPGKHGSWRDSIAIPRNVGPAAIESFDRVRQGLGRVKVPAGIMLPVSVGRRRSSGSALAHPTAQHKDQLLAGPGAAVAYSSSISFDDEDAVFADRLEGSISTACTSEAGDGSKGVVLGSSAGAHDADEEDWGWDDRVDRDEHEARQETQRCESSGALAPLREMAPFEEDFDDLDVELAPSGLPVPIHKAVPTAAALAIPSPLALEPVNAEPVGKVGGGGGGLAAERHLAPPVSVFATSLDDSASPSTSPGSTGGFDVAAAARPAGPLPAVHSFLVDRPGSALSGITMVGPSPNALGNASALSSSSGGSTSGGSMMGSQHSNKKKKKGRR